jgi:6-pyruvoyltetrahydropterin/6-carboxytetrahydropterin synthase
MHGHSYALRVTIEGQPDERGWVMDFAAMDEVVDPVVRRLDHEVLNEVPGLDNPTAELLAAWVWRQLEGRLPVVEIEIAETQDARCILRRS